MTAGNYISIAALLVSLIMMYVTTSNNKKNQNRAENSDKKVDEKQIKEETAQQTSIMIALDNIKSMLGDIKAEVSSVKNDTKENHDNLIIVQQSLKSEHKRLDEHSERLKSIEEELRATKETKE